jgi:hypothetical protein
MIMLTYPNYCIFHLDYKRRFFYGGRTETGALIEVFASHLGRTSSINRHGRHTIDEFLESVIGNGHYTTGLEVLKLAKQAGLAPRLRLRSGHRADQPPSFTMSPLDIGLFGSSRGGIEWSRLGVFSHLGDTVSRRQLFS